MPAVETLGCVTVICSDKTGTLTKGEMTVRKIFNWGSLREVTGVGYAPVGDFRGSEIIKVTNDSSLRLFLLGGLLCNDAILQEKEGQWSIKGDPTEGALVVAAEKAGLHQLEIRRENLRVEEIPFSSERKRMTTIHQMDNGKRVAFMKGAPEVVLERCSRISEDSKMRELGEIEKAQVLSLAGMIDPPREEAIEAIKVCKQILIRPTMVTGDHKLTAVAIAKEIGIYKQGDMVLTGEELEKMSDEEYENVVDKVTVYARVSPMDKLKIVRAWKKKGEVVAMTGDGVNDAPALKQADIGIAMGITGTDVSKEAADMVLGDDNFATIVKAIESGRWIYDNIKKYLIYLLESNVIEVVFIGGVVLIMGPKFLPVLPAAILYINLATDGLPAIALAVAPPDPDIMQRPPRNPKEKVFAWDVRAFILMILVIEIPILAYLFLSGLGDMTHIRTQIFFFFVITEFVIALNLRSVKYSIFKAPPHKWLLLSVAVNVIALIVLIQIPAMLDTFGVRKPLASDLGIILGACVVITVGMEVVKVILRKKGASRKKDNGID
jgi:Ca2+-transporting ATPase